jgi:leucyl aminopeptidase
VKHKRQDRVPAELIVPKGAEAAVMMAEAICAARDLINMPAADLGPQQLSEAAAALAGRYGGRAEIITGRALSEGFPCMAAVGAGSPRAPHLAVLHWEGAADGPLIALCGKGVCFDTGGLDLKPSAAMLRMKKDMGGAAVMLAVAEMVMRANLPLRLLVLIGAVENAVSGLAMRPMDVLRTRKGLRQYGC